MRILDTAEWSRLSPLLDELLDLEPPAQRARLDALEATDCALADRLRSLLSQRQAVDDEGFLEGDAMPLAIGAPGAGRRIGAYTLESELGAGGMGSVWLARRSDGRFEGMAAVKLPHPGMLAGGADRFAREAALLARLAHPNIATLLDAGVSADGQPYLVLERVEGEPIDRWCDARNATVDQRLRLFLEVLNAVEHAHQRLVLHRDLKPGNILITDEGRVKLLDFGIGKLLATEGELAQSTTALFTIDYAAPEQLQGGELTTATDVYALGVLLFELLCGVHPTATATQSRLERMRAVVETDAPDLSAVAARAPLPVAERRSLTPTKALKRLRGDLDNIVAKALKKSPSERYATAAAMADDLRRHLVGDPVSAGPDTIGYRASKFVSRHRLSVGAASAMLLLVLAGAATTTWQAIEARRERDEARYQTDRALSRGKLFAMILGGMGGADRPLTQREILERATVLVEQTYGRTPAIAAELLLPIAGQYATLGDTKKDLALMERAATFAAATGDPNLIATVACNTIDTYVSIGRFDLADAKVKEGLQALRAAAHPRLTVQMECESEQADLDRDRGDVAAALRHMSAEIALARRSGETDSDMAAMLGDKAVLLQDSGELTAALATYEEVSRIEAVDGRTLAQLATERNAATVLIDMGEYAAARAKIDNVLAHWPQPTASDPVPSYLRLTKGMVLLRLQDYDGAARELAAARRTATDLDEPRFVVLSDLFEAQLALAQGRLDDADRLLSVVQASPLHLPPHYTANSVAALRAIVLSRRGASADATHLIDAEIARLDATAGTDVRARAATRRIAARIALAAGDPARAKDEANAAVAASRRLARGPSTSADVGESLLLLALAEEASGRHADAVASAKLAARSLAAGYSPDHPVTRQALALSRE